MIGRCHHVVIDCPEPRALAAFYSELLGLSITYESDDWVVIAESDHTSGFAFQLAPDHQPPAWPDPARPQQFHLDVMVEDPDVAEAQVVAIGGVRISHGEHVYSDPAGHPFCLISRPAWAPPIESSAYKDHTTVQQRQPTRDRR
jgi:catechol 2,3-dioxygenase-like lactoylglutathione lyase family enzyme